MPVLTQARATSGQRPPPSRLLDLLHLLIQLHRVIAIHHSLMLNREDPVQIPALHPQERRPWLLGHDGKAPIEFPEIVLPQESIRFLHCSDPRHPQLLRQASLPGAEISLTAPARLWRVSRDQFDPQLRQCPPHLRPPLPIHRPARLRGLEEVASPITIEGAKEAQAL